MERSRVKSLMNEVLALQGKGPVGDDTSELRAIGFRSLDFSEVALRIEDELGTELHFDAAKMRQITTVKDVVEFFSKF